MMTRGRSSFHRCSSYIIPEEIIFEEVFVVRLLDSDAVSSVRYSSSQPQRPRQQRAHYREPNHSPGHVQHSRYSSTREGSPQDCVRRG